MAWCGIHREIKALVHKHMDIQFDNLQLFWGDSMHFSDAGKNIFLDDISGAY